MSDEQHTEPDQWLRAHQVAQRWRVDRTSVSRIAERYGVRYQELPPAKKRDIGERRYHPGDVEDALRKMRGGVVVSHGIQRLIGSWAEGKSIWDVDPGTAGVPWDTDVLSVGPEPIPDHVAQKMDIPAGSDVLVRRRRYQVEERWMMVSNSYIPLDLAAGTQIAEPHPGPGGIWKRLEELGHAPVSTPETLASRQATDEEARLLEIEPGSPVLEILRMASTAEGRVVDLSEMAAVPRYFRHYELKI
jgi:GntR family transcriptional regulator